MPRLIPVRRRAVPETPYYTGEITKTTTTEVEDVADNRALVWLLLIPVALLLVLGAYLVGKDDEPAVQVVPTASPTPGPTAVVVVPGQAPPPVIINQPPVVVTQQPAPAPTPAPSTS